MQGELLPISDEFYDRLWIPLSQESDQTNRFWIELFQCASKSFSYETRLRLSQLNNELDLRDGKLTEKDWKSSRGYVEASTDAGKAEEIIGQVNSTWFASEHAVILFLESCHTMCLEVDGDPLATRYFELLEDFLTRFSSKYDLRVPLRICPSLRGMMTGFLSLTQDVTVQSGNLAKLKREFDDSIRDLRMGCDEGRIKTCLGKQYMFIEALADFSSADSGKTLGQLLKNCDWPHVTLRHVGDKLYGLRSDYPGIGHGTDSRGVLRDIDARDLVGVSFMLTGLAPYVASQIDASTAVFQGDGQPALPAVSVSRPTARRVGLIGWIKRFVSGS